MRKLEKLTGYSDLLDSFEKEYMELKDYNQSLMKLNGKLQAQINQLEKDLDA